MEFFSIRLLNLSIPDIDVLSKFYEIYKDKNTYRLARYFIPLIKSEETRYALREFVVWDLLERNIHADRPFVFDKELGDWHMLGEIFKTWCSQEPKFVYYKVLRDYTLNTRWTTHTEQLSDLYDYIEKSYLKEYARCRS